jgi:hypothetical protein
MSGKESMALKRAETAAGNGAVQTNGEDHETFEFRENPRINAQIDGFIKQNPKRWAFIKSMSRERLERTLVWEKVRGQEQRQKLGDGLLKKIEQNPALKKDYDALMKHVPEDQKSRVSVQIARSLVFSQSRGQRQSTSGIAA